MKALNKHIKHVNISMGIIIASVCGWTPTWLIFHSCWIKPQTLLIVYNFVLEINNYVVEQWARSMWLNNTWFIDTCDVPENWNFSPRSFNVIIWSWHMIGKMPLFVKVQTLFSTLNWNFKPKSEEVWNENGTTELITLSLKFLSQTYAKLKALKWVKTFVRASKCQF